ncbi:MAG: hypothetical protein WBA11_12140, partial [Rubrivirga sp.]
MASDDRPDSARPRFTTRTLLTPQDDPGDGAASPAPEPSFGTGATDDDAALDAIVEGARQEDDVAAEETFVWAAPPVPEPTPNLDDDVFELASDLDDDVALEATEEPAAEQGADEAESRIKGMLDAVAAPVVGAIADVIEPE